MKIAILCICAMLPFAVAFWTSGNYDKKFDEMQQLKRSKAYKYSFYILLTYFVIDSTIRNNGIEWCDHDDSFFFGAMICYFFIALYLIATGSMLCPKEKIKSILYIGLFATVTSIGLFILCVTGILSEGIIQEYTLTQSFMQTVLSVMYLFLGVLIIIYYFKLKKHEKEETE